MIIYMGNHFNKVFNTVMEVMGKYIGSTKDV